MIERSFLGFEVVGYGFCGEGVAHVTEGIFDNTLKPVNLANLVALYDIREHCGIINISYNGVDLVCRIRLQMRCRESAEPHIIRKLFTGRADGGIRGLEAQVLSKGESVNSKGDISARQVGGNLRGHHTGVRTGNIDIHVEVRRKGVDDFLPAGYLLNLVKEEIFTKN